MVGQPESDITGVDLISDARKGGAAGKFFHWRTKNQASFFLKANRSKGNGRRMVVDMWRELSDGEKVLQDHML